MTVLLWVCGVLLAAGAAMAVVRAERGPSLLDRTVALDILVTTFIAAVALFAAVQRRADVVPVLVALSMVGFVGSVTVARFAAVEPPGEGRVLGLDEAARQQAGERAAAKSASSDGDPASGGAPTSDDGADGSTGEPR